MIYNLLPANQWVVCQNEHGWKAQDFAKCVTKLHYLGLVYLMYVLLGDSDYFLVNYRCVEENPLVLQIFVWKHLSCVVDGFKRNFTVLAYEFFGVRLFMHHSDKFKDPEITEAALWDIISDVL